MERGNSRLCIVLGIGEFAPQTRMGEITDEEIGPGMDSMGIICLGGREMHCNGAWMLRWEKIASMMLVPF